MLSNAVWSNFLFQNILWLLEWLFHTLVLHFQRSEMKVLCKTDCERREIRAIVGDSARCQTPKWRSVVRNPMGSFFSPINYSKRHPLYIKSARLLFESSSSHVSRIVWNCSNTKFVVIILVVWSFKQFLAWPNFRLILSRFRPQKQK